MIKSYFEISKMTCGYRNGFRLKPVDLSLQKGAFSGIIGRNGSGKSTFFKGITGELPLTDGTIKINGKNLNSYSLKERARLIATVPQFIQMGLLTVKEYVLMGRIPYLKKFSFSYSAEDIRIAARFINLLDLVYIKDKLLTELSGGELQMASIASALSQQPHLLLLDEPTSHLDISYQSRIMDILRNLNNEEELTVMMIIHDLNLASEYCTHLTLLNNGSVLRQGCPEEVLTCENIESAYGARVSVSSHPFTRKPLILNFHQCNSGNMDVRRTGKCINTGN